MPTGHAQDIVMDKFKNNQGVINGYATRYANNHEKLKELMKDKTDEQKALARSHLRTVRALKEISR